MPVKGGWLGDGRDTGGDTGGMIGVAKVYAWNNSINSFANHSYIKKIKGNWGRQALLCKVQITSSSAAGHLAKTLHQWQNWLVFNFTKIYQDMKFILPTTSKYVSLSFSIPFMGSVVGIVRVRGAYVVWGLTNPHSQGESWCHSLAGS